MKPQFALDLSNTSIRLLHLQGDREVALGEVNLDDPDFDRRVYDLYSMAEEKAKGRVRTLLLIPNSEVLYTRVETGQGDREERAKAVGEALEGMTPYALDELVFDWRADGDEAVVAAVAALTLNEAEGFATERGFNPLAFSSRPVNGAFKGIPDFGVTKLSEARKTGAPWPDRPEPPAEAPAAEPEAKAATDQPATNDETPEAEGPKDATPAPEAIETAQPQSEAEASPKPELDATPDTKAKDAADSADTPEATPEPEPATADLFASTEEPSADRAPYLAPFADIEAALAEVPDPSPLAGTAPEAPEPLDAAPGDTQAAPDAAPVEASAKVEDALPDDSAADAAPEKTAEKASDTPQTDKPETPADPDDGAAMAPGAADAPEPPVAKKRGAGRATPPKTKGRKSDPAGKAKADEPAPAFSSRRHAAPSIDPMAPPPRPAGLPPLGAAPTAPSGTPPRPPIPPHLAKPIPNPSARSSAAPAPAADKAPKTSRLSQLMARMQSAPDGGTAEGSEKVGLPPLPDLPQPTEKAPPRKGAGKPAAAAVPIHELPMPKAPPLPPRPPRANGALPDPGLASASLTPPPRGPVKAGAPGAPLPPPRSRPPEGLPEADAMTLFGARGEHNERSLKPVLLGIVVVLVLAVAVWAGVFLLGRESAPEASSETGALNIGAAPETDAAADSAAPAGVEVAALPPTEAAPAETAPAAPQSDAPVLTGPEELADAPALGTVDTGPAAGTTPAAATPPAPDSGIGPQETAQPLPDPATRQEAESRYAALGIWQIPPDPPTLPETGRITDLRLAALAGTTEFEAAPTLADPPQFAGLTPPAAPRPPAPLAVETPPAVVEAAPTETAPAETAPVQPAPTDTAATPIPDAPADDVSPEDIRVTQGPPAVTPPERPGRPARLRDIVPVNPAGGPDLRPAQRPETLTAEQETALQPPATAPAAVPATVTAPGSAITLAQPAPSGDALPGTADSDLAVVAPDAAALAPADISTDQTELVALAPDPNAEPPLRPRARPGSEATAAQTTEADADALRPQARPDTVARAETDLETTSPALASAAGLLRTPSPPSRPASFASLVTAPEIAAVTTAAPEPPTAQAEPDAEAAEGNAPLPESPYAVIASRKPKVRPKSLERQIEKARSRAGPPVRASASVKPTAPSPATVAKTATEANVLNLARLNLIGVYGGNSDRRALIRLPSGRFVKVEVGDRLDGGRVATIGDNELRYTKGGRNITLKMPRG